MLIVLAASRATTKTRSSQLENRCLKFQARPCPVTLPIRHTSFELRPLGATSEVQSRETWFQAARPQQNRWQCRMGHRPRPR